MSAGPTWHAFDSPALAELPDIAKAQVVQQINCRLLAELLESAGGEVILPPGFGDRVGTTSSLVLTRFLPDGSYRVWTEPLEHHEPENGTLWERMSGPPRQPIREVYGVAGKDPADVVYTTLRRIDPDTGGHDADYDARLAAFLARRICRDALVIRRDAWEQEPLMEEWDRIRCDIGALHAAQVGWYAFQARGLAAHFREQGKLEDAARVREDWPLVPFEAIPSPADVAAAKTAPGGWTRAMLAEWGVAWPPPRGWRDELRRRWEEALG